MPMKCAVILSFASICSASVACDGGSCESDEAGLLKLSLLQKENKRHQMEGKQEHRKAPNIVWMLMDDWGYHDVHFRDEHLQTPNIDQLASEGVVMENFYVTPLCTPSRAAFMNGRMPYRWGGADFKPNVDFPYSNPLDQVLFPEVLAASGKYRTAIVGKWDQGVGVEASLPANRGFGDFVLENEPTQVWGGGASHFNYAITSLNMTLDTGFQGYFLSSYGVNAKNYTGDAIWDIHDGVPCKPHGRGCRHDEAAWKSANRIPYHGVKLWDTPMDPYNLEYDPKNHYKMKSHSSNVFGRTARKFIEKHNSFQDGKSLFLFLSFIAPHMPVYSPVEWVEGTMCKDYPVPNEYYKGDQIDDASKRSSCPEFDYVEGYNKPTSGCKDGAWARYTQCGQFFGIDLAVGEVVEELKKAGMWDNTLIFMSGDNGGDHADASTTYPYYGGKTTAYEGGIKVPAIFAGGYLTKARGKCRHCRLNTSSNLMLLTDVSATFLSVAGLSRRELAKWPGEGIDQWPALVNPRKAAPRNEAVVISGTEIAGNVKAAILHKGGQRWKLMLNPSLWLYLPGLHIAFYQCGMQYGDDCSEMPTCIIQLLQQLAGSFGIDGMSGNDINFPKFDRALPSFVQRIPKFFLQPDVCNHFAELKSNADVMYTDGSKQALDAVIQTMYELMEDVTKLGNLFTPDWFLFNLDECEDEGGEECHGPDGSSDCDCNKYCTDIKNCSPEVRMVQKQLESAIAKAEKETNNTQYWYSAVNDPWADFTQLGWFVNPWRDSNFNALLCHIKDPRTNCTSYNKMCPGSENKEPNCTEEPECTLCGRRRRKRVTDQ